MRKVDTVIFDVGGVLVDYCPGEYFQGLGYDEETARRLRAATFDSPDWCEYDRGVLTDEEVRARFKRAAPDLSEAIDMSLIHMYNLVTRRDSAIPWIRSVREKGCGIYILSNFSATAMVDCARALDFQYLADGCFWSSQHKVIKPDAAAYLTMLHEFGLTPERSVFIDDTQYNLDVAAGLGLRTVLYRTQEQAEEELEQVLEEVQPGQ